MITKIDKTAIRFNQAMIVGLNLLAFLLNQAWLVLAVGLILALGTVWPNLNLFKQLYARILKPKGWLKPDVLIEDPAPHRFAQGVGATFLLSAGAILLGGVNIVLGWGLAWVVIVLAAINLLFNFCAGCFVYFQLQKAGLMTHPQSKGQ